MHGNPLATCFLQNYDSFEKELQSLKPSSLVANGGQGEHQTNVNSSNSTSSSATYSREYSSLSPALYLPQTLPYRPVPYSHLLNGCQQYLFDRSILYSPSRFTQPQTVAYITKPSVENRQQPEPMLPRPINDCCGKCGAPCNFRYKKNVSESLSH